MRGVVFDFDGPIFDGRKACRQALTATLAQFEPQVGRPAISLQNLPLYGPEALIALVYAELPAAQNLLPEIRTHYRERLVTEEERIPVDRDVRKFLDETKRPDVTFAILSSRPEAELKERLQHLGIGGFFEAVWGCDSYKVQKPDPAVLLALADTLGLAPEEMVFLGDSDRDYETAHNAGVAYYHAGWTGEPNGRAQSGCDVLLQSPVDLAAILKQAPRAPSSSYKDIPPQLVEAIRAGRLAFYAGAGVSVPSGIGAWTEHYLPILRELGVGPWADDYPFPELLQLVAADKSRARQVYDLFKESFADDRKGPNSYHFLMARSGASHIWTTNYDRLFERAAGNGNFPHRVVSSDKMLLEEFKHSHLIIKMNGDFGSAENVDNLDWNVVFLEEHFDQAEHQRAEIWRLLEDDYRSSCIIFVGASFKDPALRRLLGNAAKRIPGTRFRHHLLIKAARHPAERIMEQMYIENLDRQHIETHLFDDFSDIERWVQQVVLLANRPVIGFSGTGRIVDGKLEPENVLDGGRLTNRTLDRLCRYLGRELAHREFRVTSGHGPGVGVPAVEAAFEVEPTAARFYLRRRGGSKFERTAPAVVVEGESYPAMRERFIGEIDLLIALGGDDPPGPTPGTRIEIELALAQSIPVLIVAQAGGDAARFKAEFLANLDQYYRDPKLAAMVKQANEALDRLEPEAMPNYFSGDLSDVIQDLVATAFASTQPRGERDHNLAVPPKW